MKLINQVVVKYGKKRVITVTVLTIVVIALILKSIIGAQDAAEVVPAETKAEVTVKSVRSIISDASFTAVGSVSAVSEARLQLEAGGRITAVNAALGDTVYAGSIIARAENAAESASLLQAQGAYEAALAGAAQGDVGKDEARNALTAAQNTAVTTYKNAYTVVSGIVFTSLDQFYANPNSQVPGVRISTANIQFQNAERIKLKTILPAWQAKTLTVTAGGDILKPLSEAETTTKQVLAMVDDFIRAFNKAETNTEYTEADYRALVVTFGGVRGQLVSILASIDGARSNLTAAEDNVNRAQIAGSGSTVSSADAQVKIALGSLRAAQANFERTLVRTPITGVVNALYVKTGEYAAPASPAAIIANKTNGLEIGTAVSQEDSVKLAVGDTVTIDGTATGTIAAIAGAIDPTTGKVALKISVGDNTTLKNGSTVSVSFATKSTKADTALVVPLSAIKMTGSGPVVFTVGENNTLTALPVVLGAIQSENVTITSGVTLDTMIVVDARGKKVGEVVTVVTQ